jgi:hypothetical protein
MRCLSARSQRSFPNSPQQRSYFKEQLEQSSKKSLSKKRLKGTNKILEKPLSIIDG